MSDDLPNISPALRAAAIAYNDERGDAPLPNGVELLDRHRIDWSTFWKVDHSATEFLIDPVFAAGRVHSITAPAKAGKSLFALAVIAPAVVGQAALNRPAGDPLRVLYLDFEMTEADVQERLVSMGFGEDFTPESFAYALHPDVGPLDTRRGGDAVLGMADAHDADLVMIDTISRAVEGVENDADTIRSLYRHTLGPLKAAGITSCRLDHTGHAQQNRARGSSAKGDDVDVAWLLTRRDSGFRLTATHRRVGWIPETIDVGMGSDPLRLSVAAGSWPAGTAEAAAALDAANVPLDATQRAADKALRDAGLGMRSEAVRAALKWRLRPELRPAK